MLDNLREELQKKNKDWTKVSEPLMKHTGKSSHPCTRQPSVMRIKQRLPISEDCSDIIGREIKGFTFISPSSAILEFTDGSYAELYCKTVSAPDVLTV